MKRIFLLCCVTFLVHLTFADSDGPTNTDVVTRSERVGAFVIKNGTCTENKCRAVVKIRTGLLALEYGSWFEGTLTRLAFGEHLCGRGTLTYGLDNHEDHVSYGEVVTDSDGREDTYRYNISHSVSEEMYWNLILHFRLSELNRMMKRGTLSTVKEWVKPDCSEANIETDRSTARRISAG